MCAAHSLLLLLLLLISGLWTTHPHSHSVTRPNETDFHYSPAAAATIRHGANSQWGEDIFLFENYFYGMVNGIVVESGALDGIFLSNSLMFEKALGWHSILIEANPKNFKKLKVAARTKSTKIHAALCDADTQQTVRYIILQGRKNDNAISGIYEFMSRDHREKFFAPVVEFLNSSSDSSVINAEEITAAQLVNTKGSMYKAYAVNCISMRQIMRNEGVKHVHLWSLDVEGAEMTVLRSHDFVAVPVDVLLVEVEGATCSMQGGCVFPADLTAERTVAVKRFLEDEERGFDCSVLFMGSLVCVHMSFTPSVKPKLKQLP